MKKLLSPSSLPPLLLCALSLLTALHPMRLMFGVEYVLSSFWGLIGFMLYGPFWGAAAALAGSIPTIEYWSHPYGAYVLLLEFAAMCLLTGRFKRGLTTASLMFWVPVGMPLTWLTYKYFVGTADSSLFFMIFKAALNGLGNAVAASLLLPLLFRLHQEIYPQALYKTRNASMIHATSMAGHLSHFITGVLLGITLLQTGFHSRQMIHQQEQTVAEKLVYAAEQMNLYTDTPGSFPVHEAFVLLGKRMPDLRFRLLDLEQRPGGTPEDQYGYLPPFLVGTADSRDIRTVTDRVKLWSPPMDGSRSRMDQLVQSYYFVDMNWNGSPRFKIFVEVPASSIWEGIYRTLAQDLAVAFVLLAAAVLVVFPMCRRLTRPLAELAALAGKLSSSMGDDFRPKWPNSPLVEIRTLTTAFRLMSKDLNQQFAGILEATQEAMLLCDRDGTILFRNSRLAYFFGDTCAASKSIDELFTRMNLTSPDSVRPLQEEALIFMAQKHRQTGFQRYFSYSYGETKHFSIYITFIPSTEDHLAGSHLLVFRDRSDEVERAMLQEEQISQISHELRTPLTSILGFSEIMRNKDLAPERQKNYTNTIYNEAVRLSRLVDDFLDLQRMESGKQTYYLAPHDLRQLAKRVADQWQLEMHHRIDLLLHEEPLIGMVDEDRLCQVLHNLVGNAVKYSPDSTAVTMTVGLEGGAIVIHVADEGLGIPEGDKDKIFRKFYRVEHTDRRKIPGTGLGLPIAKEIVEGHQGQITFVSRHNGGSIFTVWLPLYEPPATGGTFLLIVKDEQYADTLLSAVAEQGWRGLRVGSFEEALYAIGSSTGNMPRFIAADLLGGGLMNGLEFVSRLAALGEAPTAPVLFLEVLGLGPARSGGQEQRQGTKPLTPWQVAELALLAEQALAAPEEPYDSVIPPLPYDLTGLSFGRGLEGGLGSKAMPRHEDTAWLHCYFPKQDTDSLRMQLAKFSLQSDELHAVRLRSGPQVLWALLPLHTGSKEPAGHANENV